MTKAAKKTKKTTAKSTATKTTKSSAKPKKDAKAAAPKTSPKKTPKKTVTKQETKTLTEPVVEVPEVKSEPEVQPEVQPEVKPEPESKDETSTPETEKEARKLEGAELKKAIENQTNAMKVVISRSTHGKTQQRMKGARKFKNEYGHYYGTIGSKIDRLIENASFTKKEIMGYAGTKMSKVNSHIAHLRRDVKKDVKIDPKTRKVSFG